MRVLTYEENNYDSHAVLFVAASVQAAFKELINRENEQISFYERMIAEVNHNNKHFQRHLDTFQVNLKNQKANLVRLEELISSQEWTDENIEQFDFEDYFNFNWHEVLE